MDNNLIQSCNWNKLRILVSFFTFVCCSSWTKRENPLFSGEFVAAGGGGGGDDGFKSGGQVSEIFVTTSWESRYF